MLDALRLGQRDAITRLVQGLDGRDYNAFNLMWGDAEELFVAYAREGRAALEIEAVPAGVHVLPNDRLDCAGLPQGGARAGAAGAARTRRLRCAGAWR